MKEKLTRFEWICLLVGALNTVCILLVVRMFSAGKLANLVLLAPEVVLLGLCQAGVLWRRDRKRAILCLIVWPLAALVLLFL